jgi:hypothetical protein
MRQERIAKTVVRRRPRDVEAQPLTLVPSGAPDLRGTDDVLDHIDQVLSAA